MNRLTDSEKLMYDVMGAIANSNVPVVYKGAIVTKLILREHDFEDFVRETQDIDANWAGTNPPPMDELLHSYEKLRRVEGKPEFDTIYSYLTVFLTPFIKANTSALVWTNETSSWNDA